MYAEIRVGKTEDFSHSENLMAKRVFIFCGQTELLQKVLLKKEERLNFSLPERKVTKEAGDPAARPACAPSIVP